MDNFKLFNLSDNKYKYILICVSYESIVNYLDEIECSIKDSSKNGVILIDQLLVTGNIKNRFVACDFVYGKLNLSTARNVEPNIKIKKFSTTFFKNNPNFIDNSILPKYQRQLIKEGCVI
jgi:hypothetical protein